MAKPKKVEGLDCAAGAAAGVRLVLMSRFEEMASYRDAALDFSDIEGVHDMRVASRRLRSALRDFAPHARRPKRLDRAREELKQLADALGAVRDADVAVAALEGLSAEAPEGARAGVLWLAEDIRAPRGRAREALRDALSCERMDGLRRRLARAVEEAFAEPDAGGDSAAGEETFAQAGRFIVSRSWDALADLGPSLYHPFKRRRLHKMRIAAKRLRYAFELFSACWGADAKQLAREICEIQDALGDLHDCDVWIQEIGGRLTRHGRAAEDDKTKEGLVWLLGHFAVRRARRYGEALEIWSGWERRDFASRVAACAERGCAGEGGEDGVRVVGNPGQGEGTGA